MILLILVWGIASGFGLRVSVPLMKDMQEGTAVLLSAAIPFMFVPGVFILVWKHPLWWVLIVQLCIGVIAGLLSGYLLDAILSYLLLGGLSVGILFAATRISSNLKRQIFLAYGLSFGLLTLFNVIGHNFIEGSMSFLFSVIGAMALGYMICAIGTVLLFKQTQNQSPPG
ncbi:MAG: hypothetical protein AAGI38_05755 [Bacteroidota bacterium]